MPHDEYFGNFYSTISFPKTCQHGASCRDALRQACVTTDQGPNYLIGLWNMSPAAGTQVLLRAGDAEFLHLGLEGGALHPEPSGSTRGSPDDPFGFLQGTQDLLALGFFKS